MGSPGGGWNVGVGGGLSGSSFEGGKAGAGVGVGGMSGVGGISVSTKLVVAALLGPGVGTGVGDTGSSPGFGSGTFFGLASTGNGSMTCLSSGNGCLTLVSSDGLALRSVLAPAPAASAGFLSLTHSFIRLSPS